MFSCRVVFLGLACALLTLLPSGVVTPAAADEPVHSVRYGPDADAARGAREVDASSVPSMAVLVENLLDTITQLSDWRRPTTAPTITKLPRAEIERIACAGHPCAVGAFYLPDKGVFLDDSLTPQTDPVHRSILLHELVHFVQEVNAEGEGMDPCHRWLLRERQAYALQNLYLASIGDRTGYRLMLTNQVWLTRNASICATREDATGPNAAEGRQVSKAPEHAQP